MSLGRFRLFVLANAVCKSPCAGAPPTVQATGRLRFGSALGDEESVCAAHTKSERHVSVLPTSVPKAEPQRIRPAA